MIKRVFTVKDSAPWVAVAAIALTVAAVAAVYVRDVVGLAVVESACIVTLALVAWHYVGRWKEVRRRNELPWLGMDAVVVAGAEHVALDGSRDERDTIAGAPVRAWAFWITRMGGKGGKVFDALEGAEVTFVPEPFMVGGVLAGGSCRGNQITVVGKPIATTERTAALLKHEFSHLILSVLGVPVERHHEEFEKAGLGC